MSYSKVKQSGYPELGEYQMAYHVVRESDLLAGYDITRSIIYQLMHEKYTYTESIPVVHRLFQKRMLTHLDDGLFITDYSKRLAEVLHKDAKNAIHNLEIPKRNY